MVIKFYLDKLGVSTYVHIILMTKIAKTIKISQHHEKWLKTTQINFSEWIRQRLDEAIEQNRRPTITGLKAVILAAGKDKHLFPLTETIPKTLLDVRGKTILQWQVEMLRAVGIHEIAVVRGYRKEQINYPGLQYFDNDDYLKTGSLASLFTALEFIDQDTIIVYGDILFNIEILKKLVNYQNGTTLVIDRGWEKHYQLSQEDHPNPPELATISETGPELDITALTCGLPAANAAAEFIGLAKLSSNAVTILKSVFQEIYLPDSTAKFHSAPTIRAATFADLIQELIKRGEKISGLEIWRTWIDVDTFEDYRNAWNSFNEIIGEK